MNDLLRRHVALQKTVGKYQGSPFVWGRADCLTMARSHLVAMGQRGLPKLPRYRTALGARKALRDRGKDGLEALLDGILPRVAPAAMLPGDLALLRGDEQFDALTICVGEKLFGWHQDAEGAVMMTASEIKAAYRA